MKIGQITFLDTSNNYGQVLQCFALQRHLAKLGHEVELIRYRPVAVEVASESALGLRSIATVFKKLAKGRLKERRLARLNAELDKKRDFEGFISKNIRCTGTYEDIASLRKNPPEADAYICGSDQIWGKNLLEDSSAAWFLDFGDDSIRRIAYAPSIGRDYAGEELPAFKKYLARFQSISVREKSAAKQCEAVGFNARVVSDPTLLLDRQEYLDLADEIQGDGGNYLFAYVLNVRSKEAISWNEVARYAERSGLAVRAIYSSGYYQARPLIPGVEPEYATIGGWIATIRDARCVITTSFHGVVFCILLHKPFVAFALAEKARANDRLATLLGSLGLSDRLYRSSASMKEQMEKPIDWGEVDRRLESFGAASKAFLEQALR